ncbi:MAG: hypothetical protein ACT4OO_08785 [Nitrospiraceae bacterium]
MAGAFGVVGIRADAGAEFDGQRIGRAVEGRRGHGAEGDGDFFRLVRIADEAGDAAAEAGGDDDAVLQDLRAKIELRPLIVAVL